MLVNLVLTVCLSGPPEGCRDETLTFESSGNLIQCMFLAPMEIAKWSEEHPQFDVVRWRCVFPKEGKTL